LTSMFWATLLQLEHILLLCLFILFIIHPKNPL